MKKHLLILLAILAPLNAEEKPLRILCWNIHHGVGLDGKLDLERIAKVINAAEPDLVALQEVDSVCTRSGKVDQTARLAELTKMHGVFGKAMDLQGGGYGQAVLSKTQPTETLVCKLPGIGEPRIAFKAVFGTQGKQFAFMSVHLDLDKSTRLAQTTELVKIIGAMVPPVILCGDFNDIPTSAALKPLVDSQKAIAKQPPPFTFPADNPSIEIDHFFTRRFTPVQPLQVLPEAIASDHRPLLGVFTLDGK